MLGETAALLILGTIEEIKKELEPTRQIYV